MRAVTLYRFCVRHAISVCAALLALPVASDVKAEGEGARGVKGIGREHGPLTPQDEL